MSEELFDVIFRGDILPGHQLAEVKTNMVRLFKSNEEQIQSLFGVGAVPLKRNLDRSAADRYKSALARAGADVQITAAGAVQGKGRAGRREGSTASNVKPSLKERLASQSKPENVNPTPTEEKSNPWAILPPGSDLLKPEEKVEVVAVEVSVDHISVRASGGDLLDERERAVVSPVEVGSLDFELGEVGADMLSAEERQVVPPVAVADLSADLAPVGTDLGEQKRSASPAPPDVSHISLA